MNYKGWLFITVLLFGLGLALGLATPADISGITAEEIAALEELAGLLDTLPKPALLAVIFVKNVSALMISFAFSPFLCLVPIMALTLNGWLLGVVATMVIEKESPGHLIAGLLPHGIFEVPAFIIGEAAALSFGAMVMLALFNKEKRNLLLPNLRRNLRYLMIAFALLLPAAIIETYVTPLLLQ